jgi:RimJ/RimL family protein N-acetyltransferase
MINSATLPSIFTERLVLRWLTERDVDALFAIFSNPEVMRYWNAPAMQDRSEAVSLLRRVHVSYAQRTAFRWGIARRTDDRIIGTCSLFHFEEDSRRAEVGYALGQAHWRQGYIQETLRAVLGYGFDTLNLNRIEAEIDPENSASVRAAERMGFVREGLLRERWLVEGKTSDSLILGLLKREWEARSRNS